MHYQHLASAIGELLILGDEEGLLWIGFEQDSRSFQLPEEARETQTDPLGAARQLREYFAGDRQTFSLPLKPQATAFQSRVLEALQGIPFAQHRSYQELARTIGKASAARAVGTACGRNPLPIVIPCHRVIGSKGQLTGFAGGIEAKRWLLAHEARHAGDES